MEIKGGFEQQRSKRFYLQRRERKGHMGVMQRDLETSGPLGLIGNWVLYLYCPRVEILVWIMSKEKCLLGVNRCFMGRRKGVFSPG
jgi:hypothetical protein